MNSGESGGGRGGREFWLSTPSATGLVTTNDALVIVDACPYFRKAYRGRVLPAVIRSERARHGRAGVRWHEYASPPTGRQP